jgi:hypothetical protein
MSLGGDAVLEFVDVNRTILIKGEKSVVLVDEDGEELRTLNISLPNDDPYMTHDPFFITLFERERRIASWAPARLSPVFYEYSQKSLGEAQSIAEGEPSIFLGGGLGVISQDTLYATPLRPVREDGTKLLDTLIRYPFPRKIVDYNPFRSGVAIHSLSDTVHFIDQLTFSNVTFKPVRITLSRDSLLQDAFKFRRPQWDVGTQSIIIFSTDEKKLYLNRIAPATRIPGRIFKNKGKFFTSIGEIYQHGRDAVWLYGSTRNGRGFARVDLAAAVDSLTIIEENTFRIDEVGPTYININNDGLNFFSSAFDSILYISNSGKAAKLAILGPEIRDDLSEYVKGVPHYSNKPEIFAVSPNEIGAAFQISTELRPNDFKISTIYDKTAENAKKIQWPTRKAFDVDTEYDYFYGIILIIGCIIIYFFGLFYTLDFKNGYTHQPLETAPAFKELNSLREKLQYTRATMGSLKLRSEIMLWMGLAIGVAGMLAFVYSLKNFFADTKASEDTFQFTIKLLRTFGIFSFMEVFSFYFLRQYRIVFNDYKRFFSLYLRLVSYYQVIELADAYPEKDKREKAFAEIREAMLKDSINMHEDGLTSPFNEFEKSGATDIAKNLSTMKGG